ncbi:MAG: hypothetical protein ABIP79_08610 [Chitinophagaceae bacterium]
MTPINTNIIPEINSSLDLQLATSLTYEQLHEKLADEINKLINHDFEKLIFYLYRIDVHEDKMRTLLEKSNGEDAAVLIADLIIDRQLQKIKSRQLFSQQNNNIDEEEKW